MKRFAAVINGGTVVMQHGGADRQYPRHDWRMKCGCTSEHDDPEDGLRHVIHMNRNGIIEMMELLTVALCHDLDFSGDDDDA